MVRRRALALLGFAVVLAGGASVIALRASGDAGCPPKEKLQNPIIDFHQHPQHYIDVTLTNPNDCYGFDNEPVEITLFAANRHRLISYYGEGPPHEVGVCCNVTLPPRGTWTIRLGDKINSQGADRVTVCNIRVEAIKSVGYDVWKRMPHGGAITGQGSFPPNFRPGYHPPDYTRPVQRLPYDPIWRKPCESPSPSPS